jgi:hypothetical protein
LRPRNMALWISVISLAMERAGWLVCDDFLLVLERLL